MAAVAATAGRIAVTGAGAVGIFAQSGVQGTSGNIVAAGGPISATFNGSITGGSGTGAVVQVDGGDRNTITLSGGTVGAASGTAILASGGNVGIENAGTLQGNVVLQQNWGDDADRLHNQANGVFTTGDTAVLGRNGVLSNHGIVVLGPYGTYNTTALAGSFTQSASVELITHVDFLNRQSAQLQVSGTARAEGLLQREGGQRLPRPGR